MGRLSTFITVWHVPQGRRVDGKSEFTDFLAIWSGFSRRELFYNNDGTWAMTIVQAHSDPIADVLESAEGARVMERAQMAFPGLQSYWYMDTAESPVEGWEAFELLDIGFGPADAPRSAP